MTPRDLAAARYAQNHEYMDKILGPTRLGTLSLSAHTDMLSPPPSPYADTTPAALEKQIAQLQSEVEALQAPRASEASAPVSDADADADAEPWARAPSQGPVLGMGYVRAQMPAEVAEILERQRAARQERAAQPSLTLSAEETARRAHAAIEAVNRQHAPQGEASPASEAAPGATGDAPAQPTPST